MDPLRDHKHTIVYSYLEQDVGKNEPHAASPTTEQIHGMQYVKQPLSDSYYGYVCLVIADINLLPATQRQGAEKLATCCFT